MQLSDLTPACEMNSDLILNTKQAEMKYKSQSTHQTKQTISQNKF